MIEKFRSLNSHPIMRGLLFIIAISFIFLWGGQEGLRMIGLSRDSAIATVGGTAIKAKDLQYEIARTLLSIKARTGQDISYKQASKLGIEKEVLNKLVNDALFKLESENLGIAVSDQFIANFIKKQKAFLDNNESFSQKLFERYIRNLGFAKERNYVNYLKNEILRSRLLSAISKQFKVLPIAENMIKKWRKQERTFNGMIIDPKKLKIDQNPSNDVLREYYGKNPKMFITPSNRTFDSIILDLSNYKTKISPKEIDTIYALEKSKIYKGISANKAKAKIKKQLMQEKLQEIVIDKYNMVSKDFDEGISLKEISTKYKLKLRHFSLASLHDKYSDLDKDIVKFAFSNELKTLSTFEQSKSNPDTFMIVLVNHISPSTQLSFEKAIPKIKEAYTNMLRFKAVDQLVQDIKMQLSKENNFITVAAIHKLTTTNITANRKKILSPKNIKISHRFINRIFELKNNQSDLIAYSTDKNERMFLLLRLVNTTNPTSKLSAKESAEISKSLNNGLFSDISVLYLQYLRNKYPVEVNKKYFKI